MAFQSAAQLTCGRGVLTAGKRRGVRGGTGTGTGTGTDPAGAQGLGGEGVVFGDGWIEARPTPISAPARTRRHTQTRTRAH